MGIIFPPKIDESGETIKPIKQDIKFPRATANIIGVFWYFLDRIKKSDSPKALIRLNMPPKNILPDGLLIGACALNITISTPIKQKNTASQVNEVGFS